MRGEHVKFAGVILERFDDAMHYLLRVAVADQHDLLLPGALK